MARRRRKAARRPHGNLKEIITNGKQKGNLETVDNKKNEESLETIQSSCTELPENWPTEVMRAFFDHHGVVSQNIESFNKFLTTHIHDIITKEPIVVECYSTVS